MKLTFVLASVCAALSATTMAGCDERGGPESSCEDLQSGHGCTWLGVKHDEGFNGDGHHRVATVISQPQDLLFLPDGTPWFTDFNNFLIRRVLPDDTVETMVGSSDPIFPGDGPFAGIPPGGAPGSEWLLNHPTALLLDDQGSLIVVAWHNHKLLKVEPTTGFVEVMCGSGAGFAGDGLPASATTTLFRQLNDATFDDGGNLYVVDQQNGRIRRIDRAGVIETIAGDGTLGYQGDGGPAIDAQFSWARGSNPNPSGGIVHHRGKLYISDTERNVIRVLDLASGTIDRFAGALEGGDPEDGALALDAKLQGPRDLEVGPDGDLYFADTDSGRIRAINFATGRVRTVAGTGELGLDEDDEGRLATEIPLRRPFGLAFDHEGNLYVLDTLNSRIVKVAR